MIFYRIGFKKFDYFCTRMVRYVKDKVLGLIALRVTATARKYKVFIRRGRVVGSMPPPPYGEMSIMIKLIEENKAELLKALEEEQKKIPHETVEQRKVLISKANAYLPQRLAELAIKYGFSYRIIRIKDNKSRWGSCSSLGAINLSLGLMRLPYHLIDYVLLHELCHTVEMNHGPRFWALMDKVTEGEAKKLRLELRKYSL